MESDKDYQANLKLYRNIGKIYVNNYLYVKKMKDFDFQLKNINDNELDDISQAIVQTISYLNEKGFENFDNVKLVEVHEEKFELDNDPSLVHKEDDDEVSDDDNRKPLKK